MRLEIDAPGWRSRVRRSTEPNCPHAGQEKVTHGTPAAIAAADRGIEPQSTPAGLPRVPDSDDLLRISDRLAIGLGALRFCRGTRGSALPFLRSACGPMG
jgi:hypothetical protein